MATLVTVNLTIDGVVVPVQLDTSTLPPGPAGAVGPVGPQGPAGVSTVDIPTLATAVAAQLASTVAVVDIETLAQEVEAQLNGQVTIPPATSITDSTGNVWTIAAGVVQMNGKPAGFSAGVTQLAYVKPVIWQFNGTLWFSWNGTNAWNSPGTATAPK